MRNTGREPGHTVRLVKGNADGIGKAVQTRARRRWETRCRAALAAFVVALPVWAGAQTNTPLVLPDAQELYGEVKAAIAEERFGDAQRVIDKLVAAHPAQELSLCESCPERPLC